MISFNVISFVLLVGGGLLVDCQYTQDENLLQDAYNQGTNDKFDKSEVLTGDGHRLEPRTSEMFAQWPASREDRKEVLERIASGLIRGTPKSDVDQYRALLRLINGERGQQVEVSLDPNIRYDIDSSQPVNVPDDQTGSSLSKPVNDPNEFEARLDYWLHEPTLNAANQVDLQQFLMGVLNQTRDEFELAVSEEPTSVPDADNQQSQRELERLVDKLDQWFEQPQTRGQNLDDVGKDQQQTAPERQQEQSVVQLDASGIGSSAYGSNEYIDQPLALAGHLFVQGGAGEGRQLLGPEGTYENVQVVKTDTAVPSYCDPPNPCPLGYTAKDGCLENFVNSASFSREYQAQQKCSCDDEHSLFNCAASITDPQRDQQPQQQAKGDPADDSKQGFLLNLGNKLDTLARTVQNRFGNLAFVQRIIGKEQQRQEQVSTQMDNDDLNSNHLVRSARKLSALDMHHKVELD